MGKEYERENVDRRNRQYHPAFCAAMELELRENRDEIICESEHNLNTMPNRIDLLVVKKNADAKIKSGLGAIFRKYNLMEFKSADSVLDAKTYHRMLGYVHLYVAYESSVDSTDDITVSFVRERKPIRLMKQLREWGFEITEFKHGIYHLKKKDHVDMQIVVTRELGIEYDWLRSITNKLTLEDAKRVAKKANELQNEQDKIHAQSVFDLITRMKDRNG